MSKIIIAALLASAAAAPAFAQDTASGPTFTGAHVEALGGWDRLQANNGHDDGVLYGVGAGYDIQRGGAVIGIEGEATDSTQKERVGALTEHASRDLYAGARVGVVVGGTNLLYAKAGYTNARYGVSGTGTDTFAHGNLDGVRVGAGVEHALGSRAFVKAEYRYSNYEQGVTRNQVVGGIGLRF
ncbi:outer membrane protein [Sphingomonas crusticola]|uniref:outer membrane protein n=1 Tax=Sphingomonas crusticola TaxID=1697973 RepID=UPI000E27C0C3|nr:porin family protein [Sphingomonas crusticola]